jgi:hypothetical protein
MTINFKAIEFKTAGEAIQEANASGCGAAIALGGKYYAIFTAEAERLEAAGVEFAYVFDHEMPDGTHRIVTVPVND